MKTLIFNGSPRKNGDTVALIKEFTSHLKGDYKIVNTYYDDIKPCIDCRYCWANKGCSIEDGMTEIYDYIQVCDNIVIASPLYFSELTGQLLTVTSRLQTYFCSDYFRKEQAILKEKKGGVIIVGGGDGKVDKAYNTAKILLHHMNVKDIQAVIYSRFTNITPSSEDSDALNKARDLALLFNK